MALELFAELMAGLALLAVARGRDFAQHPAGRYWMGAWGFLYLGIPLQTLSSAIGGLEPLILLVGSFFPFLFLAGALALRERPVPRALLVAGPLAGAVRAGLVAAGMRTLALHLWLPVVVAFGLLSAWHLARAARDPDAGIASRWLPLGVTGYTGIHAAWVWSFGVETRLESLVMVAVAWCLAAAAVITLQALALSERRRAEERRLLAESRRAQEALQRRDAFERLVNRISTRFVCLEPEALGAGMDAALEEIGRFAGVDRSLIFEICEAQGSSVVRLAHEWAEHDVPRLLPGAQDTGIESFTWCMGLLRAGRPVVFSCLDDLPPEAASSRARFEEQGVVALAAVPLALGSEVIGVLRLDHVRTSRRWAADDLALLDLAADLFANAIARQRAARALAERELELRHAQKLEAIGRLAGGIAHDFNNLLTAIQGYGELALAGLAPDAPVRADVEEMQRAAERAARLTRQMLAFGRRQVLSPRPFDLNRTVSELEQMLRRLLGDAHSLEVRLAPDLEAVLADPGQVEQAAMNLVLNARDALPEGGVITLTTERVRLGPNDPNRPADLAPGVWAVLTVADAGTGIAPEALPRVFEPFFTTKSAGEGTGLGLAMVYGFAQQSGGAVHIESELGKGTTVRLFLPLASPGAAQPVAERAARGDTSSTSAQGHAARVLVVEDEPALRRLMERWLSGAGYRVVTAPDGVEALAIARAERFDLLVTDVRMPRMGGVELVRRLSGTWGRRVPVLFVSGHPRRGDVEAAEAPRGGRLVPKPFSRGILLSAVAEALDASPPEESGAADGAGEGGGH